MMVPALVATSIGFYCQYSKIRDQVNLDQLRQSHRKRVQKLISQIPLYVDDLSKYDTMEIQAITKRNTIKNKLIGRLNRAASLKIQEASVNKQVGSDTAQSSNSGVVSVTIDDEKAGSSSLYSTSSMATDSSESCSGKINGILKLARSKLPSSKNVCFAT